MEPDPLNFNKFIKRHENLLPVKLHQINGAACKENTVLEFKKSGGRNSSVCNPYGRGAIVKAEGRAVDSLGAAPTLIKFDVEGCEKEALEGARQSIGKYKPRLILSVYHRTEDLLDLPLAVNKLNPEYRLYLRHHPYIPAWDTNLYCV